MPISNNIINNDYNLRVGFTIQDNPLNPSSNTFAKVEFGGSFRKPSGTLTIATPLPIIYTGLVSNEILYWNTQQLQTPLLTSLLYSNYDSFLVLVPIPKGDGTILYPSPTITEAPFWITLNNSGGTRVLGDSSTLYDWVAFRFTASANNTKFIRRGVIKFKTSTYVDFEVNPSNTVEKVLQLNIELQGFEYIDPSTSVKYKYQISKDGTLGDIKEIKDSAAVETLLYSKNESIWDSDPPSGISIKIAREDGLSQNIQVLESLLEWIGVGYDATAILDSKIAMLLKFNVRENEETEQREEVLHIKDGDTTVMIVTIGQDGTSENYGDVLLVENKLDKYWEGEEGEEKQNLLIIDNNLGIPVSDSSLLFKSNAANIYKALEQKDNTLFLGNYILSNNNIALSNILDKNRNNIYKEDIFDKIEIEIDASKQDEYAYIPNLTLSSYKKRLFKKGEIYALGMVFLYKDGSRSTVYFPNTSYDIATPSNIDPLLWSIWDVLDEPFIRKEEPLSSVSQGELTRGAGIWNLIVTTTNHYYYKPVRMVTINADLAAELISLGIIGVIPVYAVPIKPNVLCQGFISPTMQSVARLQGEGIECQYSWYYRNWKKENACLPGLWESNAPLNEYKVLGEWGDIEIQNLAMYYYPNHPVSDSITPSNSNSESTVLETELNASENTQTLTDLEEVEKLKWKYYSNICTLNTPEVEFDDMLMNSNLKDIKCTLALVYDQLTYINAVSLNVNGKYVHSKLETTTIEKGANDYDVYTTESDGTPVYNIHNYRYISGNIWRGFWHRGDGEADRIIHSSDSTKYRTYIVYPWQRSIIGGEPNTSQIVNKRIFNTIYAKEIHGIEYDAPSLHIPDIEEAIIYKDYDSTSIVYSKSKLYLGNVDYIIQTPAAYSYKAWLLGKIILESNANEPRPSGHGFYSYAPDNSTYAGYDDKGNVSDIISMKYKAAPHIVLNFGNNRVYTLNSGGTEIEKPKKYIYCTELSVKNPSLNISKLDLKTYQWIKCGDLIRINPNGDTRLFYEEGDFFYGRYDSLRTYCYSELDVNSIIEVVSANVCSRINLDSRCDRNRGVKTPIISPTNFNIFNSAYNQLSNYFTFQYLDLTEEIYQREYSNSILWSMSKLYGSVIDTWCNIQEINTMDFDGDRGDIKSILKFGNNLFVFQDSGIAQIQYNDKTQLSVSQGIPIEVANSGKVTGKNYLYDKVGCQNPASITKSISGLYFIDGINKALYAINLEGALLDLTSIKGLKSWGLDNLDRLWWTNYDSRSQEVLFSNNIETLSYSDLNRQFNSFLGYGGIRYYFTINNATMQLCPPNFELVLWTTVESPTSSKRIAGSIYIHGDGIFETTTSVWLRNSIPQSSFFGEYSRVEVQLLCGLGAYTIDKTFTNVEYKMDCFDDKGDYLSDISFDTFRAWNEYQDTDIISLTYGDLSSSSIASKKKYYTSRLKKKFRIWRLDIPRVKSLISPTKTAKHSDRIRNPWCNFYFSLNTNLKTASIVLHDVNIQYI